MELNLKQANAEVNRVNFKNQIVDCPICRTKKPFAEIKYSTGIYDAPNQMEHTTEIRVKNKDVLEILELLDDNC